MKQKRVALSLIATLFSSVVLASAVHAGDIQGFIRSAGTSFQPVNGAIVTAYNHNTGRSYQTTSGHWIYSGSWNFGYRFNGLPNGTYTISARYYNPQKRRWENGSCSRCCTLRNPQSFCQAAHVTVR